MATFGTAARKAIAALLAVMLVIPTTLLSTPAYADEIGSGDAATKVSADDSELKIAVISDTHYYPLNFVSDCPDYTTYVGGDPKMLEESGSILDAAVDMIEQDDPDIVLVSGDLTKDGEKLGHEQFAERLQKIENDTDAEVFVINGNHDIYNYIDACTFENGAKESAETTSPDQFKDIYANFGYNGEFDAQYFENPNHDSGEIAGELSYSVDLGRFTIIAVDSGMYSPDAGTGYDTNEHVTAGRVDEDLLPWVTDQIEAAEAEGDTVIGLMHHGLVPHFEGEEDLLSEYVVENWRETATAFADAGMRYIFTGHMHANDIADFTTVEGNTIHDLETASLASYGSPVRSVTLAKGEPLGDGTQRTNETFAVSSRSVQSINFLDHTGETTYIEDFNQYTMDKLYSPQLLNNMANGMLSPMLDEIGETGLVAYLSESFPELDLDSTILGFVQDYLSTPMSIELGTGIGRANIRYANGGIQIEPSGTAGLIGNATITDAQIPTLVYDVIDQIETRYIDDPDALLAAVDSLVTKVSNFGVESLDASEHTLYDFLVLILTGHYAGAENPPEWVDGALQYIESGEIVSNLIDLLLSSLLDDPNSIVNDILNNTYLDIDSLDMPSLLKTALNSMTDNGRLSSVISTFGLDIRELVEGLISEYMSPSFLTGMGGLIHDIAYNMLYDTNGADDVENGDGRTIVFDGTLNPQAPSIDNGLLPTELTMSLGTDPQTERQLRWFTGTDVASATVRVSESSDMSDYEEFAATFTEVVKPDPQMNLGLITTYGTQSSMKHSATITGLELGKTYYYQVGDFENGWTCDPIEFTTGDAANESFTFINVNDSQGMIASDYATYLDTLAKADGTFSNASFAIHGGDFVDDGANEDYWAWALDDPSDVSESLAYVPVTGNHEERSDVEGITDANPVVSHFNLANVPDQDLSTGVYYSFEYKNALFIVLNTNDLEGNQLSAAQVQWAAEVANSSDAQWKIIAMHKSPYSNGPHAQDDDVVAIRSQIDALCASCDIDLVLSGHDHVYNRTPYLSNGTDQNVAETTTTYQGQNYSVAYNPTGTMFVIAGTAGVKNYEQDLSAGVPSKVNYDLDVPVYSGITIDGDTLYYRAYKVEDGASVDIDNFAISKSDEQAAPAWKQVEDMIAALPAVSDITTDDAAAIQAAREAYNALDSTEQAQVSNLAKLESAEKMLATLNAVAGKRTVTVTNDDDFYSALADSSIGTILTSGTIEFDEGGVFDTGTRELYVDHDVVVGGTGTLRYCRFHVRNGATLVLQDSLYVNDTRSQGSWYDALNPVEIEANSTLVTRDAVSLRTEYGTGGSDEGVAVKLIGDGAAAILGSTGQYWGSEAAIYSTVANSSIVINGGVYNLKNDNHSAVDSPGTVDVNGGEIASLWCGGTLTISGGTFEHQDSASNTRKPVQFDGGDMYVTGGTFVSYDGAAIQLGDGSRAHMQADIAGAVTIDGAQPFVGGIQTENYKDVSASYNEIAGTGANDGIYRLDADAASATLQQLASAQATKLDGTVETGTMSAQVPNGTSSVFGKYQLSGDGKSLSGITGGAGVYVYGPMRVIENVPVESAVIAGEETRVVEVSDGAFQLTGYTLPANAFDNAVTWGVDNTRVLSLVPSFTLAQVSPLQAGYAKVTMTANSNAAATDSVEVFAVDPSIAGPDAVKADTEEEGRAFTASAGFSDDQADRITFRWSVSDQDVATIDPETGVLTPNARGTVTVIADLFVDGESTGISVEKDVLCDLAPTIDEADAPEIVNAAIDVAISEGNELMAEEHQPLSFDELIEGSYEIGEPYETETPASNPLEALGRVVGLLEAPTQWRVDVVVSAQPYLEAFEAQLEADGVTAYGSHELQGDPTQTVTLLFDEEAGWQPETDEDAEVSFVAACTTHTVSFSYVNAPNGVEAPGQMGIQDGKTFALPTAPTVEHYTFAGWYADEGCKVLYNPQDPVEGDLELFGLWVENEPPAISADAINDALTVTMSDGNEEMAQVHAAIAFDELIDGSYAIGGVEGDGTAGFTVDVAIDADPYLAAFVERYGEHALAGEGSATATFAWNADAGVWEIAGGSSGAIAFEAACEFVAVTYEYVGAPEGAEAPEADSVQAGEALSSLPDPAEIVGYTFEGWYADPACETTFDTEAAITEATTVYGKWEPRQFRLAFDADGDGQADEDIDAVIVTYDGEFGELPAPAAQPGKIFVGWALDGEVVEASDAVKITGDAMLTAQWADKQTISVTPDEGNVSYVYDGEGKPFAFDKTPDVEGFTVEYRAAGAGEGSWTTETPTDAGFYDVRLTRAEDDECAAFEQVYADAVVIAKASSPYGEPDVEAVPDGADVSIAPAEGEDAALEWSTDEGFADPQPVGEGGFDVAAPGDYYVRPAGDENHEPGEAVKVTIVEATFDADGGELVGSGRVLLEQGSSLGERLPSATRDGFEFAGWFAGDSEIGASTPIDESVAAVARWGEPVPEAPEAPTGDELVDPDGPLAAAGFTVTLNGVNEINSEDGNKSHPDMTFEAGGEPGLIVGSFELGRPVEQDGAWTVVATVDGRDYLDAYSGIYGAHYFASADEGGASTLTFVWNAETEAWQLADGFENPVYDIMCLTLRPADSEIYTGGESENGGHFIDQYVVDGQGVVSPISELNELLAKSGQTAAIRYYNEDGEEILDDTVPGVYTARIDIRQEGAATLAETEDSVEIEIQGEEYVYALEPAQLTIRSVSDAADAERGDFNVALVDGSDPDAVKAALADAAGGVVASVPETAEIRFNGDPGIVVEERGDVTLFSDDLLPGGRDDQLVSRAEDVLDVDLSGLERDFQYLDLVDYAQSNAWVSSSEGTTVYWRLPEGADPSSVRILHFKDLHRDYSASDEDVADLIAACDVEEMEIANAATVAEDGYASFFVPEGGFSPFLMVWSDSSEPEPESFTATFDPGEGALPEGASSSVQVEAGQAAGELPVPVRDGYEFAGWYSDSSFAEGSEFTAQTLVTADVTVYAKWEQAAVQTVFVVPGEGGGATASNVYAVPGELVEIATAPDESCRVSRIVAADESGATLHVSWDLGSGYSFEMPADGSHVTVTIEFLQTGTPGSFPDVPSDRWYRPAVDDASSLGLMNGASGEFEGLFVPDASLTRAEMAQIIYNLAGRPSIAEGAEPSFTDCDPDQWYAEAVTWCSVESIIGGYDTPEGEPTGLFGPFDLVSREQIVTMLWRLQGEPEPAGDSSRFPDGGSCTPYAAEALAWGANAGVINGSATTGELLPGGSALRCEVAQLISNYWRNVL